MSVSKMTRIAFLSAVLYVSKVLLEFAPNVELVSFLTILYTLVFGKEALLIVTVFNLFELVQWGFGLWLASYFYVWPLLCLLTLAFRRLFQEELLLWALLSGLFGLAFGSLFALAYVPADPAYALSYWISGLPWDVWHGAVNFTLMLLLGKPVLKVLKRIKAQES